MDNYTATEQAYKNGYEQGLKDAVKEGEWEVRYSSKNKVWCSVCGDRRDIYTQIGWNFCPNCGARMKG